MEIHGFNLGENGLSFLGTFVESLLGSAAYFWWIANVRNSHFNEKVTLRLTNNCLRPW
jgi:hypothetical protein